MTWQEAYRKWQELADRGYGPRCNTLAAMKRVDDRIRKAKDQYERLLADQYERLLADQYERILADSKKK